MGKRLPDISGWTEDEIGNSLAYAFSRGTAGPIIALRRTCPTEFMRKKYRERWHRDPPWETKGSP